MFHLLCQIAPHAADNAQGFFSSFPNIDGSTMGTGGAAAVLGGVWFFFKVIRKIIGTLFMACVVYLVMKVCLGIDLAQFITPMMGH